MNSGSTRFETSKCVREGWSKLNSFILLDDKVDFELRPGGASTCPEQVVWEGRAQRASRRRLLKAVTHYQTRGPSDQRKRV
jgi:hypothetical protein